MQGETAGVKRTLGYVFERAQAPGGGQDKGSKERAAKAALDHLRQRATPEEASTMRYWLKEWSTNKAINGEHADLAHDVPW